MKFRKYINESFLRQEENDDANNYFRHLCPECDTPLNDMGTCPKCDEGEEDYGDLDEGCATESTSESPKQIAEKLDVRAALERAYPDVEFNWKKSEDVVTESVLAEDVPNSVKLARAYPGEFSWDTEHDVVTESIDSEYDDEYEFEDDDVEQDRIHAALYGGDRMYCDCGTKLVMDEWGGYCPKCEPKDPEYVYEDSMVDDEM